MLGLKGVDWGGRGGDAYKLGNETSSRDDTGLRREVDCEIPHWLGRRTRKLLRSRLGLKRGGLGGHILIGDGNECQG